jgi:membrane-associated phospholipid phosphatase
MLEISNYFARGQDLKRGIISSKPDATECVITPLSWLSLACFVTVDLIWLPASPLTVAVSNLWAIARSALLIAFALSIRPLISRRLEGDQSSIGSAIRTAADGVDLLARAATFTIASGIAGGTYMYLATTAALPLQDARLAALDQALGFDWLQFLAITNSSPAISWVLVAAYHSAFPQVLVLYLLLSFSRRERRLAEFLTLLSLTSVVTGALILFAPAAGAYAHFAPARELFDGFSSNAGMWHYETLTTLRTQAPSLDFTKIEGLVTFPSYHTVLAIIMAYAFRGFRFIALPAVILNSIMIISTLPEGGHYLVDIIGGAIVALAGIGVVRWEQRGSIWTAPAGAAHGVGRTE